VVVNIVRFGEEEAEGGSKVETMSEGIPGIAKAARTMPAPMPRVINIFFLQAVASSVAPILSSAPALMPTRG
jgi:hypothetical protein